VGVFFWTQCITDQIKVRAVWGQHARLDQRWSVASLAWVHGLTFHRVYSVTTHLRCGGIYGNSFITNCLLILTVVKEFWKSVNIWRNYKVYKKLCHFGPPCTYVAA